MRIVRCIAIVLPLAIALGCSKEDAQQATAPKPPAAEPPGVQQASWVTDQTALSSAVRTAEANPLVQRALVDAASPRLTPLPQYAVRLVGSMTDGSVVGITVLPYMVDQDQTHAVYVSLLDVNGRQRVDFGELILGREPTSLEEGFQPKTIGDLVVWYRGGANYTKAVDGAPRLAPERFNWARFMECTLDHALTGCSIGAAIGAPIGAVFGAGAVVSGGVGCGVGAAFVMVSCGFSSVT